MTQTLSEERVKEIRAKNVTPAIKPFYTKPLHVKQAQRQWVWDVEGRRYLDLYAGVVTTSVGHCHPRVVRAASEQMSRLAHITTYYLYDSYLSYAEKLAARMPGKLKARLLFLCSPSNHSKSHTERSSFRFGCVRCSRTGGVPREQRRRGHRSRGAHGAPLLRLSDCRRAPVRSPLFPLA